jgi:hypothetical protein
MRVALRDLALDHLTVIYTGDRDYALADRIDVVPFAQAAFDAELVIPRLMR